MNNKFKVKESEGRPYGRSYQLPSCGQAHYPELKEFPVYNGPRNFHANSCILFIVASQFIQSILERKKQVQIT